MSNRLFVVVLSALVILCCCNNQTSQGQLECNVSQEPIETALFDYDCVGKKLTLNTDDMIVVNNSDLDGKVGVLSINNNKPFTMVVYIGEDQCTTCRLKAFHVWDDFIELMSSDNINYYFIVKPKENDDIGVLKRAISQTYFSRSVYLDMYGHFLSDNSCLVPVTSPFSCLTDVDGTILYVGDPFCGYETMSSVINSHGSTKNGNSLSKHPQ